MYRLVTRSDFDGLVCAVLLKAQGIIDEITFVHPKDMQDGKVAISDRDITTNLPYVEGVHLCFDHHASETLRVAEAGNRVIDPDAPSAARVVYNYYGGKQAFPTISEDMMDAVDKGDSAQYTVDEVLNPDGWPLLNFIMDARTGLGRFRQFRISNYQLMMSLIDFCRDHSIDEILALPDVKERVDLYREHQKPAQDQLRRVSRIEGDVVIIDYRPETVIWATNRFTIYAMHPESTVSVHMIWGLKKQNTVLAVGKSIIDRSSPADIGELMLSYGGGGHHAAGTCQIANDRADQVLGEILPKLQGRG